MKRTHPTAIPSVSTASYVASSNPPTSRRLKQAVRKKKRTEGRMPGAEGEGKRFRHPNWDTSMDRLLIDLMLKEMHRNNYPSGNFNTHSWTTLSAAFNTALGTSFSRDQVKEHWKNVKKKFGLYEELLKLSGWGWDDQNKIPIPGYEGAWDEVIKVNPRFSLIKRRPFPLYDDVQILCKNSMATGDRAEGTSRRGGGTTRGQETPTSTKEHIAQYRNAIPSAPSLEEGQFETDIPLGDEEDFMNISFDPQTQRSIWPIKGRIGYG